MKPFYFFLFSCFASATFSQSLTAEEKVLEDWLPTTVGEYKLDGAPVTVTSKASDKPYSMSSKNYKKGTSVLAIVIFDYKNSPDLLKKYTSSWLPSSSQDGSKSSSRVTVEDLPAWESVDKKAGSAQLYVNIKDRYLLFLSVAGNSPEFLRSVAKNLRMRTLPL